jgi:hypothetical protein
MGRYHLGAMDWLKPNQDMLCAGSWMRYVSKKYIRPYPGSSFILLRNMPVKFRGSSTMMVCTAWMKCLDAVI